MAALSSEEKYPEEKYDDEGMDDEQQDNVEKRLSNNSNRNSRKTTITFRTKTEQASKKRRRSGRPFLSYVQAANIKWSFKASRITR